MAVTAANPQVLKLKTSNGSYDFIHNLHGDKWQHYYADADPLYSAQALEQVRGEERAKCVAEVRAEADKAYAAAKIQIIDAEESSRWCDQGELLYEMAGELEDETSATPQANLSCTKACS